MQDEQVIKSPVKARAGFLDRPVLMVLVVSVALAVLVLGLTYAGFFKLNA